MAQMARGWPADVHIIGKDILRFHAVYYNPKRVCIYNCCIVVQLHRCRDVQLYGCTVLHLHCGKMHSCARMCTSSAKPSSASTRSRGGLVFKAHRLCLSLNSRLESNEEEEEGLT